MPHGILYRLNLLFRTSRLFTIRRLGLVIVFSLDDPVLLFHLGNIQICHMKSVLLLHPILDLLVCSLGLASALVRSSSSISTLTSM